MSVPAPWPQVLDFFGTPLVIEPSPGQLSSDAGLLPIRQFDEGIGLIHAFAAALDDPRNPTSPGRHTAGAAAGFGLLRTPRPLRFGL